MKRLLKRKEVLGVLMVVLFVLAEVVILIIGNMTLGILPVVVLAAALFAILLGLGATSHDFFGECSFSCLKRGGTR